jgi:hypothetical protein
LRTLFAAGERTLSVVENVENVETQLEKLIQSCAAKIGLPLLNIEPSKYNSATKWKGSHNPGAVKPDNRSRPVFNVALALVTSLFVRPFVSRVCL